MPGLASVESVVVLMLENRSMDHMLGYLYSDSDNVSPSSQPFEGLTGEESNPDATGKAVEVFPIEPDTPNAYLMPGADPGEGYMATNIQLYGSIKNPAPNAAAPMTGFVKDFEYTLKWQAQKGWSIVPGTSGKEIMGCFAPKALPVLSGLARGYAVCDHWFGSAPTETLPNRAFLSAGTSQAHMDDKTKTFTAPSIFGAMSKKNVDWAIYGYKEEPLAKHTFTDIVGEPASRFGTFADFTAAAHAGTLPAFVFLEPAWSSKGNSQHPNDNVASGEQLIHDVYYALRNGPKWDQTLLILTYDEHGGCFDHVPPPWGAVPPDHDVGEFGFDFTRFGPRVPTVLVSPLIPAGTVLRVPDGSTPFDHTSVLKTLENRWGLKALTARDAAAPDVSAALTLDQAREDDPLDGVAVPASAELPPEENHPSHLQEVLADLISRQYPAGKSDLPAHTRADYERYTQPRENA
jgi:phospholipase C